MPETMPNFMTLFTVAWQKTLNLFQMSFSKFLERLFLSTILLFEIINFLLSHFIEYEQIQNLKYTYIVQLREEVQGAASFHYFNTFNS